MSFEEKVKKDDPTFRDYHLKCFVEVKRVTFQDEQSKGISNGETTNVYLIPDDSTEAQLFLTAWMPVTTQEHFECAAIIGPPVRMATRLSIHAATPELPRPHLFVMYPAAEEALIAWWNEKVKTGQAHRLRVDVKVLSADQEEILG